MTAVQQIDRFVKELGTRNVLQVLRQILARWSLVLGVALVTVHLVVPDFLWYAVAIAFSFLLIAAGHTVWRQGLRIHELDRALELRDRLATWQGLKRRGKIAPTPMTTWLADDLVEQIDAVPEPQKQAAVRRRIGALRYLLPVLIILLVIAIFEEDDEEDPPVPVPPLPLPSPPEIPSGGIAGTGGQDGTSSPSSPTDDPGSTSQPLPQASSGGEPGGMPPTPEPANPLPDLELRDEFAVPHFVGEGETRRQLARQARLAESLPPAVGTGGVTDADPEPPVETDFERAYERALQSRHVPEHERPFLRRYFRILREAGR